MPIGRTHSVFTSLTSSIPHRWLARYGCIACFVYTACLVYAPAVQPGPGERCQVSCMHDTGICGIPRYDPRLDTRAQAALAPAVAKYPLVDTFKLHSRKSASKTIYLDFDGHATSGTGWNNPNNAWTQSYPTITTLPFDNDGDSSANFTDNEKMLIQEMWDRVAECFSPFDVNVTTEAPPISDLVNSAGGDIRWGVRVAIGDTNPPPEGGGGGWGFVGGFGGQGNVGQDVPCFVFNMSYQAIAVASVHEVGHTLGLSHDGYPANGYYPGHGSGPTGWAPHMGVGYYRNLVQWSKGEYSGANNQEDDLAIITTRSGNGFGYRPDDFANSLSAAKAFLGTAGTSSFAVNTPGVIETLQDADWFKITAGSGTLKLDAKGGPVNTMLDIQLSLFDSKGAPVLDSNSVPIVANPADDVIASINQALPAGIYFVKIEGVSRVGNGSGTPPDQGYSDYSSTGQYTITGSFSTKGLKGAPVLSMPPGTNGDLFYGVKELPKVINPKIQATDVDNPTLPSATVKITPATLKSAEDVLSLKADPQTMGNITSSYDKTTGTLTLTSAGTTATVAQFQAALRAVSYSNTSNNPNNTPRKVEFQVNDGTISSNILTSTVTIGYFYVTAAYDAGTKTLTLADDIGNNSILITLRAGQIAVEGAGSTRIGTSSSSSQAVAFPYSGDVKIVGNFAGGGSDVISVVSVKSSKTTLNLGDEDDKVYLSYCNIADLTVNGGNGADLVTVVSTVITKFTYTSLTKNGIVYP